MNSAARMLTMTGMAIVAGAMFSAGPAAAASASPTSATSKAPAASQSSSKIVKYYRSERDCERAGRIGERRDKWDDYDCYRVRSGHHRARYALRVSWDHRGHGHDGHNNNDNREEPNAPRGCFWVG